MKNHRIKQNIFRQNKSGHKGKTGDKIEHNKIEYTTIEYTTTEYKTTKYIRTANTRIGSNKIDNTSEGYNKTQ